MRDALNLGKNGMRPGWKSYKAVRRRRTPRFAAWAALLPSACYLVSFIGSNEP